MAHTPANEMARKINQPRAFVKRFLIVLGIGSVLFVSIIYYNIRYVYPGQINETRALNKKYFDNFNYSFSGLVTDYYENRKVRGDHFGVVTLELKQTDIDSYDPSDTTNIYFCLIKKGRAKVIVPVQYELERRRKPERFKSIVSGDSLVFDGRRDKFLLYFDNDSISWTPMWISTDTEERSKKTAYLR
jgi:hypothetical protein